MLLNCHSILHPCSLTPGCGNMVYRQQHRIHMATETRAKLLLAFGSLSSKHHGCQA